MGHTARGVKGGKRGGLRRSCKIDWKSIQCGAARGATMLPLSLVDAMFAESLCRPQVVVQLSPAEQEIEEQTGIEDVLVNNQR